LQSDSNFSSSKRKKRKKEGEENQVERVLFSIFKDLSFIKNPNDSLGRMVASMSLSLFHMIPNSSYCHPHLSHPPIKNSSIEKPNK
jgi:hypothetical protein